MLGVKLRVSDNDSEVAQSCLTLCNPMDSSQPSSSIHGIFQARVLEWGATAFSEHPIPTGKNEGAFSGQEFS